MSLIGVKHGEDNGERVSGGVGFRLWSGGRKCRTACGTVRASASGRGAARVARAGGVFLAATLAVFLAFVPTMAYSEEIDPYQGDGGGHSIGDEGDTVGETITDVVNDFANWATDRFDDLFDSGGLFDYIISNTDDGGGGGHSIDSGDDGGGGGHSIEGGDDSPTAYVDGDYIVFSGVTRYAGFSGTNDVWIPTTNYGNWYTNNTWNVERQYGGEWSDGSNRNKNRLVPAVATIKVRAAMFQNLLQVEPDLSKWYVYLWAGHNQMRVGCAVGISNVTYATNTFVNEMRYISGFSCTNYAETAIINNTYNNIRIEGETVVCDFPGVSNLSVGGSYTFEDCASNLYYGNFVSGDVVGSGDDEPSGGGDDEPSGGDDEPSGGGGVTWHTYDSDEYTEINNIVNIIDIDGGSTVDLSPVTLRQNLQLLLTRQIGEDLRNFCKVVDTDLGRIYAAIMYVAQQQVNGNKTLSDILKKLNEWPDDSASTDPVTLDLSTIESKLDTIISKMGKGDGGDTVINNDNDQTLGKQIGEKMNEVKERFPFSIPWDVMYILGLVRAEPVAPQFDVPVIGSDEEMHIDLSQWEPVAVVTRNGTLVLFGLGLALRSRTLIRTWGGTSD